MDKKGSGIWGIKKYVQLTKN